MAAMLERSGAAALDEHIVRRAGSQAGSKTNIANSPRFAPAGAMKAALPLVLSLLFFLTGSVPAADSSPSADLGAIEHRIAETLEKGDGTAFARFFAADWKMVLADGKVLTVANIADALNGGKLKFRSVKLSDLEVRSYGETAVLVGVEEIDGSWDGEAFRAKNRFTDVFIKKDGGWQCIASHSSKMSDE
jgi:ketosteroid isomerase-like protein